MNLISAVVLLGAGYGMLAFLVWLYKKEPGYAFIAVVVVSLLAGAGGLANSLGL